MGRHFFFAIAITVGFLIHSVSWATPSLQAAFLNKYPFAVNSDLNSCATCHMPAKDGFSNPYGMALRDAKMQFEAIEDLDSDNDGKKNLDEIKAFTNPGSQADKAELFIFVSKMPPVTFDHANHVINPNYTINGNCTACHGTDATHFPKLYDAKVIVKEQAHATCVACHKASGHASAPTKCTDCHKK